MSNPLAYGIDAGADALGIGRTSIYNLIRAGRLHTTMIAGRQLILHSELERLAAKGDGSTSRRDANARAAVAARKGGAA